MNNPHSRLTRLLLAAGLSLGVLATAGLGGSAASAQPAPGSQGMPALCPASGCMAAPIHNVQVKALGTEATLTFNTLQPAAVTIDYKPASGPGAGGQSPAQGNATAHERTLRGLRSNTTHDVTITATTQAGQKHTTTTSFTTSKQRVRVTLREINITEDGDLIGNGEPSWLVRLAWAGGKAGGCYPNNGAFCETGSHGEGRIFPRNYLGQPLMWLFAEENFDTMPAAFTISASGEEYDLVPIGGLVHCLQGVFQDFDCPFPSPIAPAEWRVPAGREFASSPVAANADGGGGFESGMTFTFELFHDTLSYPSARNTPQSTWAR